MLTDCSIELAGSEKAVMRCFPLMKELRPLLTEEDFLEQVRRQGGGGYRLAFAESRGVVRAVAGFRLMENLAWGRYFYVDDLVTRGADRANGWGSALFDWLLAEARREGCGQIHLDSGVERFGAHRFYLHKGMDISAHHFALKL